MNKSNKPIIKHITDFLDWLDIEKGLANKSQENYSRFLKKFSEWSEKNNLQSLLPHQLTSDHIFKYKTFLARQSLKQGGQQLKRTTQNYYLIALRSLLTYFADKDIVKFLGEPVITRLRYVTFLRLTPTSCYRSNTGASSAPVRQRTRRAAAASCGSWATS